MVAAIIITGIADVGNIIISNRTVASGLFIINAINDVVITITQNAEFNPVKIAKAYPKDTPEKMHGKKCPPLNPIFIQTFVINIFIKAVSNNTNTPIDCHLSIISVIWCSPENIVYGSMVPVIPKSNPEIIHFNNM